MVRELCRRLRTSERLSRFLGGSPAHHLVLGFLVHERPLDRRAVYRYLTRHRARWRSRSRCSPAPTGSPRAARTPRPRSRRTSSWRAELMAAALDWRADGPPRAAAPRRRAGPGARHRARARARAAAAAARGGGVHGRGDATASEAVASSPGPCARIPTGDRRLRGLRGRTPARRQGGPASTPTRGLHGESGAFAWIGLYEPTPEEFESLAREFDLHPLAVEDAINAHQRPKLEVYRRRCCSSCSRPRATSTRTRSWSSARSSCSSARTS